MINQNLIRHINNNEVWAFVGSGPSIDSGHPSWLGLLKSLKQAMIDDEEYFKSKYGYFNQLLSQKKFPECFEVLAEAYGKNEIQSQLKKQFNQDIKPGTMVKAIAEMPFKGYITTNYDTLIEQALTENGEKGWISAGNTDQEIGLLSGDPSKVVWHIHGSIEQPAEKSKLILTDTDYEWLYNTPNTVIEQIRHLISKNRIIFIGYGFADFEFNRVIKQIGRRTNPANHLFAFLGKNSDKSNQSTDYIFSRYNISGIFYDINNASHAQLSKLLKIYGSMMIKRSQEFGKPESNVSTFDSRTSGLLIYNELVLKNKLKFTTPQMQTLFQSVTLALLGDGQKKSKQQIIKQIKARISPYYEGETEKLNSENIIFKSAIQKLENEKLLKVQNTSTGEFFQITPTGKNAIKSSEGEVTRLARQFESSVRHRCIDFGQFPKPDLDQMTKTIIRFFNELIEKKALGVALAFENSKQSNQLAALLEDLLPKHLEKVANTEQANCVVNTIQDIFADSSNIEDEYIGLTLQARFAIHLLSLDSETLKVRIEDFRNSAYILDSTTLIPLGARSSTSNYAASRIVSDLKDFGASIFTTPMLTHEVAEHISWAMNKIGKRELDVKKIPTKISGNSNIWNNAFIDGYLNEFHDGKVTDFFDYISSILNKESTSTLIKHQTIENYFTTLGIPAESITDWEGFTDSMHADIENAANEIARIRKSHETYKHDKQVRAEAEALIAIKLIREKGTTNLPSIRNAHFISNTRIIDDISGNSSPITIRAEMIIQLLATLGAWSKKELSILSSTLIGELFGKDHSFINKRKLEIIFGPYVNAAKERFQEILSHHRVLMSEKYGENPEAAFQNLTDFDFLVAVENLEVQVLEESAKKIQTEKTARIEAEKRAALTEKQKGKLNRIEQKERIRAQKRKQRKANKNSNKKKKKKRK